MADYYPVLKRAISSLPSSSGDARRIVYEKARAALLKQLQSYDPPLSPSDVTDQRMALEECIRRIESEVAGAAYGLPESAQPQPSPQPPPPPPPEPAPVQSRPISMPEPRVENRPEPRPEPRRDPPPPPPVVTVQKPLPRPEPQRPVAPPTPPPAPQADPKIGAGISALSKTLRQADELGGASSQAVRSARGAIEEGVPPGSDEKIEPNFLEQPLGGRTPPPVDPVPSPAPRRGKPIPPRPMPAARPPAQSAQPKPAKKRGGGVAIALILILLVASAAGAVAWYGRDRLMALIGAGDTTVPPTATPPAASTDGAAPAGDGLEPKIVDRLPQDGEAASPVAPDAREVQTVDVQPPADADFPAPAPDAPPAAIAVPTPAEPEPSVVEAPPAAEAPSVEPAETPVAEAPATEVPPATGTDPQAVLVAQRAILYEEPVPGSEGARVDGRVVWSVVNEPVLPGEPAVPQVRAVVEIPERSLTLTLSIRENADAALPASHIVEARFDLPPDFPGTSIDTTPGLILKPTEDARGDALIGAVAKVADNLFWVALSGTPVESERNLQLLGEREWIDVPIRYGNRRRAILTFEKGPPGNRAVQDALAAWAN
jgi:hypothetical protein